MNYKKLSKFQFYFPARAPSNFPDAKKRNKKKFDNWKLKIIPFIGYLNQMDFGGA